MSTTSVTNGDNKAIWSQVCETDPRKTKAGDGKGYSFTAINNTWLAQRATEVFGPIGIGWGFDEVEHMVIGDTWFSKIALWYMWNGERSAPVVQWGATPFRVKRRNGDVVEDDEAPKKAITDGWTKCLSLLGFTADIRLGMFDDNKHVANLRHKYEQLDAAEQSLNGRPNGNANGNGNGQHHDDEGASAEVMNVAEEAIRNAKSIADLARIRARVGTREDFSADQRSYLMGLATSRETELAGRREPAETR